MARQDNNLSLCGCCEGAEKLTPAPVENRPLLSELAYRIGTHGRFKQSMQVALSEHDALRKLTRDTEDPTIALLDGWATVLDVLAFYQERIANEGYMRTAGERRSVLELARRIGYELGPGVAAETHLAFELETAPEAPASVTIATGTKVQSVPGQDEFPQTFETVEEIEARPVWNSLKPRLSEEQAIIRGTEIIWIEGVTNNLNPGDPLLFVGAERRASNTSEHWDLRRARQVDIDRDNTLTRITLDRGLGDAMTPPGTEVELFALRKRAALFGHNAPDFRAMPDEIKRAYGATKADSSSDEIDPGVTEWPDLNITAIAGERDTIYLEATYPDILQDSWVVLEITNEVELYGIDQVDESSRAGFALTAKSTKLRLDGERLDRFDEKVRETTVHAVSEPLTIAERPLRNDDSDAVLVPVEGRQVVLDQLLGGNGEPVDSLRARALEKIELVPEPELVAVAVDDELEILRIAEDGSEYTVRTSDGVEGTVAAEQVEVLPAHQLVTGLRADKSLIFSGKRLRATPSGDAVALTSDGGATRKIEPGESLLVLQQPRQNSETGRTTYKLRTDDGFEGEVEASTSDFSYLPAADGDEAVAEHATIDTVRPEFEKTAIILSDALDHIYDRTSVEIKANVARATHGESKRSEVLGSGKGSETFRKFTLANSPLTYVQATNASGSATTLSVRVDSVLWEEVPNFFGASPDDRVYTTRQADDGTVTVQFGDGITGARLPTGTENVTADYRVGIGLDGLLDAGQLKLLMTQTLGVKKVTNPLPPSDAEDPDSLEDAREVAPGTVLTLDRVVSLRDYEDFARAFAGVSKALAAELWEGEQRIVHLTVAGFAGSDPPADNLLAAIDNQRHAKARVIVRNTTRSRSASAPGSCRTRLTSRRTSWHRSRSDCSSGSPSPTAHSGRGSPPAKSSPRSRRSLEWSRSTSTCSTSAIRSQPPTSQPMSPAGSPARIRQPNRRNS